MSPYMSKRNLNNQLMTSSIFELLPCIRFHIFQAKKSETPSRENQNLKYL